MSFFPEYKVQNIFSRPLENFIYILLKLVFLVDTEERTTPFSLIGTLIDKCFLNENKGIKLFCCFIDFQKVFDTVWHDGLLIKLILNKIYMVYKIANEFFRILNGPTPNLRTV